MLRNLADFNIDHFNLLTADIDIKNFKSPEDNPFILQDDFFIFNGGDFCLLNSHLSECACAQTAEHNRLKEGNTRTIVEQQLVTHITTHFKNQSVRILSFGAGGLLQELRLVAILIKNGFTNIHLTMVDLLDNNACFEDLQTLFEKIKTFYPDVQLTYENLKSIYEVGSDPCFDVIYAVDNETFDTTYHDYSGKQNDSRKRDFSTKEYINTIDLIKALTLLSNDDKAIAMMSRGYDVVSFTQNALPIRYESFVNLAQLNCNPKEIDYFYLNTSLSNLVYNLTYLNKAGKTLIINKQIILPSDQSHVEKLLQKFAIPYEIREEKEVLIKLNQPQIKTFIMDYTIYDPKKNENPIQNEYKNLNICTVRYNWNKKKNFNLIEGLEVISTPYLRLLKLSSNNEMQKLLMTECSIKRFYYQHHFFQTQQISFEKY